MSTPHTLWNSRCTTAADLGQNSKERRPSGRLFCARPLFLPGFSLYSPPRAMFRSAATPAGLGALNRAPRVPPPALIGMRSSQPEQLNRDVATGSNHPEQHNGDSHNGRRLSRYRHKCVNFCMISAKCRTNCRIWSQKFPIRRPTYPQQNKNTGASWQ